MYLWQDTMKACVVVILAVSLFQVVAGLEESDARNSNKILNRNRRQEEDTFNYAGLWISIGVFLAFDGMIVAFGIYKSYFGEIHMPVKREDRAPKDQNGKTTSKKEGEAELTAVNPTFIDDEENHAATQTDFPDESEEKEGAVSSTEAPVIYTV